MMLFIAKLYFVQLSEIPPVPISSDNRCSTGNKKSSVQFSRFLFPPLVEQNTYINVITLRKKGHATKRIIKVLEAFSSKINDFVD